MLSRILLLLFCFGCLALADTISLNDGQTLKGSILQRQGDFVTVAVDYGVVRYNVKLIKAVNGKPLPATTTVPRPAAVAQPNRLPKWKDIVTVLSGQSWGKDVQQIPATVVDKGVMKNVPYLSFKCGGDYEVNIYGDPDNPAGIEIGVYRSLLGDEAAKRTCVEFLASLLGDKLQRDVLRVMDTRKSVFVHGGVSMEITPETDEDAYGGWWVSVYKESALNAARAPDAEVDAISVSQTAIESTQAEPNPLAWSASEMTMARKATSSTSPSAVASVPSSGSSATTSAGYGGGRVYVRGYLRKNGTYVSGHSRRK